MSALLKFPLRKPFEYFAICQQRNSTLFHKTINTLRSSLQIICVAVGELLCDKTRLCLNCRQEGVKVTLFWIWIDSKKNNTF